jgi:hypothetical protein
LSVPNLAMNSKIRRRNSYQTCGTPMPRATVTLLRLLADADLPRLPRPMLVRRNQKRPGMRCNHRLAPISRTGPQISGSAGYRKRQYSGSGQWSQGHPGTKALNPWAWGGAPEVPHQISAGAERKRGCRLGRIGYVVCPHTQVSYPIVPGHLKARKPGRNSRKQPKFS